MCFATPDDATKAVTEMHLKARPFSATGSRAFFVEKMILLHQLNGLAPLSPCGTTPTAIAQQHKMRMF